MSQALCRWRGVSPITYCLVILFGISSWVDINGLWVELPILVQNLPEKWDLPSYMAVIIQIGNIAPFIYTVSQPRRIYERPIIYAIIIVGAISCLLLSFLWDVTSVIGGVRHSTALFVLQFFLALVDCTSSVAFLPFMALLRPQYMTAYFIGEGFSGLIPSLVALAQGAGSMECLSVPVVSNEEAPSNSSQSYSNFSHFSVNQTQFKNNITLESTSLPLYTSYPVYKDPHFTVRTFFIFLMFLVFSSGLAFTLLNYWSHCKRDHVSEERTSSCKDTDADECLMETRVDDVTVRSDPDGKDIPIPVGPISRIGVYDCKKKYQVSISNSITGSESNSDSYIDTIAVKSKPKSMTKIKYGLFLILTGWLNALSNGVLPSLQTYSCLPYGIQAYHLSVTFANIANPIACFATFLIPMTSVLSTLNISVLGTGLASYIIYTAVASPEPPLVNESFGSMSVILVWIFVVLTITFCKVSMAALFRQEGKKALLWVGASTQVGSLCGSLITFFLINHLKIFEVANPCR